MDLLALAKAKMSNMDAKSGRRAATVKAQLGKTKIRVLPGWRNGDQTFWQDFGLHFIHGVTPDKDGKTLRAIYLCVDKVHGRPCPICEAISSGIATTKDDAVHKALGDSASSSCVLVNALVLTGDDKETPVIFELRPSVFRQILDLIPEYGDITSLDEGIDLIINREGSGLNTKYTTMPAAKSAPVPKSVMDKLNDLDEYVKQEYDQGLNKALIAVGAVAGALPAPSSSASASIANDSDELGSVLEDDEPIEGEIVSETLVEDVVEAPVAESAATATVDTSNTVSDDELDDLLAELG